MVEGSRFAKSLRSPFQWLIVGGMLLFIAGVAVGPIVPGVRHPMAKRMMQKARTIALLMFQYSTDHQGRFPIGNSSTEVFQKLLDEQYATDPTIFWDEAVPGKIKPTSNKLRPENVCWDVTIPVDANSSDLLPVVFLTGYKINYIPRGSAVPLVSKSEARLTGIAVAYHANNATWVRNDGQPDGVVTNFISPNFDPAGKKYQQLTPDGPLAP